MNLFESFKSQLRDFIGGNPKSIYGQHEFWLSFYDYFREVCGLKDETRPLEGLNLLAKNAGWAFPYASICWVCERHNVCELDDGGRLHCETGPAISFPDGFRIYAWHGLLIDSWLIEGPEKITIDKIVEEENVEIRRIMIEIFGTARFIQEIGAEKIHEDEFGILHRREMADDEPIVMVEVVDATPEPDGTYKHYFLRVPPHMERAKQAVAWTFDEDEDDYNPLIQT